MPNKSELYLKPAFTQQTVVNMSSASVPAIAAEDPDILALSQSLKALGIGAAASCLRFAKALEEQGVLSLERLKKLPVDKVQKVLEKVQMSEIQIETIMEAIASAPASVIASDSQKVFLGSNAPPNPRCAPTHMYR